MSAETILKMIESVDPADTAKLDEIDARVACYLDGWEFKEYFRLYNCEGTQAFSLDEKETLFCPHYTRSRDALKAIRPEGYGILSTEWHWDTKFKSYRNLWQITLGLLGLVVHPQFEHTSEKLPTEELAELHAIIQAIEYERVMK